MMLAPCSWNPHLRSQSNAIIGQRPASKYYAIPRTCTTAPYDVKSFINPTSTSGHHLARERFQALPEDATDAAATSTSTAQPKGRRLTRLDVPRKQGKALDKGSSTSTTEPGTTSTSGDAGTSTSSSSSSSSNKSSSGGKSSSGRGGDYAAPPGESWWARKQRQGAPNFELLKVSGQQNIGSGAAFVKRTLKREGKCMLVARSFDSMFQAIRVLRCARTMLAEEEGHLPAFQPSFLLEDSRTGLTKGSTILYIHKLLEGNFDIPPAAVMKVAARSDPTKLGMAIRQRIKEHGVCVLESFGRQPAVSSLTAIATARRHMIPERMDVAVVLDPVVTEVDREDLGTTLMNRFVLMECAVRDPTNLRVKVSTRLRSSAAPVDDAVAAAASSEAGRGGKVAAGGKQRQQQKAQEAQGLAGAAAA